MKKFLFMLVALLTISASSVPVDMQQDSFVGFAIRR